MGTKLTELRDGCFARALDDEPMFVLLARDPTAPELVATWAGQRMAEIDNGARPSSDVVQVREARDCARNMVAWREKNDGAWRTGLFATAPDPVMTELREKGIEPFVSFGKAAGNVLSGMAPRYARDPASIPPAPCIRDYDGDDSAYRMTDGGYDEQALIRDGRGEYVSAWHILPPYVWGVLIFAAGFIVGRI